MENIKSLGEQDCSPKPECLKTETKKFKIEKNDSEEKKLKAAKVVLNNIIKSENDSDKGVRTQVLKRKYTEDGAVIERVLSEGETSSGFETVSSINSNNIADLDDLELSSLSDGDNENENDFNVIVKIENELAYRNKREPEKRVFYKDNFSPVVYDYKNDYYASEYTKTRLHKDGCCRRIKCWDSTCDLDHYKCSRKDKRSSEREITDSSRRSSSYKNERYTKDSSRKSRWSDSRSRHSRSSEKTFRSRNSRTPDRKDRRRCSNIKDRKAESRHSGSSDKYSSNSRRNSPIRKRRRSSRSRSPSSVWSRLDSHSNTTREKKERSTDRKNSSTGKHSRKKERTPFLVELERKLKEADNSKKEEKMLPVSSTAVMPQMPTVLQQNLNLRCPLTLPTVPVIEGVYHFQYQQMPTLSTDNLPLVPGPTGLPVYISPTGEQIPHDMDGKRIPVGSNGYYLPVDPTGRLFPHIVSPVNQAIPIHMTDDGVLRLPNSDPVPYGPSHQLPVNVDGSVIYIGPDSKPLYPCSNLPRMPPLHLLNLQNASGKNTVTQQAAQESPQTQNQVVPAQTIPQPQQGSGQFRVQPLEIDLTVAVSTENSSEANGNENLLKNQKQSDGEKTKNDLVNTETNNNLDVSPSARAVKRSMPVKLLQSKAPRNSFHSSAAEIILKSSDSVLEAKTALESGKGSNKDDTVIRNEEQGVLEIVCGNKSFTIPTTGLISDDPIVRKTEHAIKSLAEKNYKPPVFGRFIISDLSPRLVAKKFPNESPLLRNRIKLPFVTPNAKGFYCLKKPVSAEKTKVTFKFLPQKSEKGEKLWNCKNNGMYNTKATKRSVFTFDFAMQCDFTSVIIKNLNSKVVELENEVVRLRKANANLLEDCRNAQAMSEKKSDELRKALLEIQERNSEILSLKCSLKVQE